MATIIDSLIVELGLDPTGFTKGQKEAGESWLKMRDQANKGARDVDNSSKKMANSISTVRNQVLSLMAAFLAGKGIKEFIQDQVTAEAQTARLAKTLGQIPGELAAWRGIGPMVGGTADGITGSIQNLVSEFQNFALTGESSVIPYFRALGVTMSDENGRMKNMTTIFLELADAVQGMDPAKATALLRGMGLDQGTINAILLGRNAIQDLLAEQQKLGVMTEEDMKAGLALQHAWLSMEQASTSLGRTLLTAIAPVLDVVLQKLTDLAVWAREHKPFLEAMFTGLAIAAAAFAVALSPVTLSMVALTAAVVAAIAAVSLLYDDWKVWTEGGQSAFGEFWQFFADKWASIKDTVLPAIHAIWQNIKDGVVVVADVLKLIVALFTGSGDEIRAAWSKLGVDFGKYMASWVEAVKKIGPALLSAFKEVFGTVFKWAEERATAIWNAITGKSDPAKPKPPAPAPAPSKAATGGKPTNAEVMKAAQASEEKYGIPAQVTYAQWALESNYGKNMPAGSNNPFGIKAKAGQPYVEAMTNEFVNGQMVRVKQKFAKYDSLQQAFDEHAKLLATSKHYANARAQGKDAGAFADALTGVYATDPNYGAKLKSIMARNGNTNSSTSTSDTRIGEIKVYTQATDAPGIARALKPELERNSVGAQANYAFG